MGCGEAAPRRGRGVTPSRRGEIRRALRGRNRKLAAGERPAPGAPGGAPERAGGRAERSPLAEADRAGFPARSRDGQRQPLKAPGFFFLVMENSATSTVATSVFGSTATSTPVKSMLPPPQALSSW